jgi:hypothetical protein
MRLAQYYEVTLDGRQEMGAVYTYVCEDLVNAETGEAFDLFDPDSDESKGICATSREEAS